MEEEIIDIKREIIISISVIILHITVIIPEHPLQSPIILLLPKIKIRIFLKINFNSSYLVESDRHWLAAAISFILASILSLKACL